MFTVPIDKSLVGVGQIVAMCGKEYYYLAIYDVVFQPDEVDVDAALDARVMFLALSLDALLWHGDWPLIGHRPVSSRMPLPAFKEYVDDPDHVDVVDYSGKHRRPARGAEAELLPYRKVVAPVRLENALRAKHGLEPWSEAYSDLAPTDTMTTERLFG